MSENNLQKTRGEIAYDLFKEGYNCTQAVVGAFAEEIKEKTNMDFDTAMRLASSFGGGMGRMREVCGAVSGMFMVAGILRGYDDPKDTAAKQHHYALIQRMAMMFKEENGSIICRDLLSGVNLTQGSAPTPRTSEFYKKRPCTEIVRCAADIAEKVLLNEI